MFCNLKSWRTTTPKKSWMRFQHNYFTCVLCSTEGWEQPPWGRSPAAHGESLVQLSHMDVAALALAAPTSLWGGGSAHTADTDGPAFCSLLPFIKDEASEQQQWCGYGCLRFWSDETGELKGLFTPELTSYPFSPMHALYKQNSCSVFWFPLWLGA